MHIFIGSHCLVLLSSIGKGSQMCTSGSHNLSTLGRDDDTVGVDEEVVLEDVGDGHGGQLQMCPLGSNHISRFSRDHGTVRVSNQMCVQVEGSGVSMVGDGSSVDSSDSWAGSNGLDLDITLNSNQLGLLAHLK